MPGRVLIVEDEYLIRLLLEDMLEELGFKVGVVASSVAEGNAQSGTDEIDLAILDVNIDGEQVFTVAEVLKGRNLPFCFITGYGAQGLPEQYRAMPTLQKPFQMADLKTTLAKLTGG